MFLNSTAYIGSLLPIIVNIFDDCYKLNDELIKMVAPFKEDIDIRPDRKKANINNIIKYFSLPYECKKANKQHSIIRTDVTMDDKQATDDTGSVKSTS